jgi:tetratricopeptide (TPR) repeat protein
MLDCQLYGLNPGMHHTTNLILHVLNSLLLFLVFKKMTGALWRSAFVAALFALHPVNVESVAWVAERKNVLSTFFWILTMLTYAHYSRRKGLWRYLLTLFMFLLGLMCKPMLVTLPFVLLLIDYWPLQRFNFTKLWEGKTILRPVIEKVPFVALSVLSFFVTTLSLQNSKIMVSMEFIPLKLRVANALISYVKYLGKIVWPQNLAFFYPFPKLVPGRYALFAGILLTLITIMVFREVKTKPYLGVGWFWYIVTLIPVSGLIQAGLWPAMADRWAYVPLIGIFIIVAWGVPDLIAKWRYKEIGMGIAGAICILGMMILSWLQVGYWRNSFTLYEHALDVDQNNAVAHYSLGTVLAKQGKPNEAMIHLSQALRINPAYARAYNNVGAILFHKGKIKDAIAHFKKAVQLKPDYHDALNNLKISLNAEEDYNKAISNIQENIKRNPKDHKLLFKLGNLYKKNCKWDEAIDKYQEAILIKPEFVQAIKNVAEVYALQGKYDNAVYYFKKMKEAQPDDAKPYYYISCVYSRQGNIEESIYWLKKAVEKRYNDWELIQNDPNLENIRSSSYYKKLLKEHYNRQGQ